MLRFLTLEKPEGRATSRYFGIFFRDSIDIMSGTTIGQTGARRAGRRKPSPGRLGMAHLHSLRDLQMRNLVGDDLVILVPTKGWYFGYVTAAAQPQSLRKFRREGGRERETERANWRGRE
jgi:hypothetical protein